MNEAQTKRASELAKELAYQSGYAYPWEVSFSYMVYLRAYAQAIADSQAELDKLKRRAEDLIESVKQVDDCICRDCHCLDQAIERWERDEK